MLESAYAVRRRKKLEICKHRASDRSALIWLLHS